MTTSADVATALATVYQTQYVAQGTIASALASGNSNGIAAIAATYDSAEKVTAALTALPAVSAGAPSITMVMDDIGTRQGTLLNGSTTDDTTPTVRVSLAGTGAMAGAAVQLYDGETPLGTAQTLAAADIAKGYLDIPIALKTESASITATLLVDGQSSAASAAFRLTLDTAANAPINIDLATAFDSGNSSTDNLTNVSTPLITGSGAEAGATITLYDSNGTSIVGTTVANSAGLWSLTSSKLSDGVHTLTAKQTDAAGNESRASSELRITVDTKVSAPDEIDLQSASDSGVSNLDNITSLNTPTISGVSEAGATIKLYDTDGTTLLGRTVADVAGKWSVTSNALADGVHTLTVQQIDLAGNTSAVSSALVVTIDTTAALAPSIAAVVDDQGTITGSLINGSRTDDTNLTVRISLSGSNASVGDKVQLFDANASLGAAVTLSAADIGKGYVDVATGTLNNAKTYDINAKVIDVAGNISRSSSDLAVTVDTIASAPTSLVLVDGSNKSEPVTLTNETAPIVKGSGAESGSKVTLFDSDGTTVLGTTTADAQGGWSITSKALSAGTHTLSVKQTDLAGNTSTQSSALVVTITSPVILNSAATAHTADVSATSISNIRSTTSDELLISFKPTLNSSTVVLTEGIFAAESLQRLHQTDRVWERIERGLDTDVFYEKLTSDKGWRAAVLASETPRLQVFRGIADQVLAMDDIGSFVVPMDAFVHTDAAEVISLQSGQVDGSPLPDWVQFDQVRGAFKFDPPEGYLGEIKIKLTARDSSGREVTTVFRLHVTKKTQSSPGRAGLTQIMRGMQNS